MIKQLLYVKLKRRIKEKCALSNIYFLLQKLRHDKKTVRYIISVYSAILNIKLYYLKIKLIILIKNKMETTTKFFNSNKSIKLCPYIFQRK